MSGGVRALASLLVLLLVGCGSIPTSGPVSRVSAVPGRVNQGVEIAPAPPAADATPVEIIEGFLHAMASYQPGYRVARSYLTPAAQAAWDPDAGVRVYAEGTPVAVQEQGSRLSAPLVGLVDAQGGFTTESGGRLDHDFGLVRDSGGQWRVSRPPEGLVLSEYLFRSSFVRVPVYFYAAGQRWLLPDSRYFPRGQRALERAVAAVFAGPTTWAAPLVEAPVAGPRLVRVGTTESGEAEVVVDRDGALLADDQRSAVLAQLAWTLRGFETVTALRVLEPDGTPWALSERDGRAVSVTSSMFADRAPESGQTSRQLFGVLDGRLARLNEGTAGIDAIPIAPGALDLGAVALRHDGQQAAVVNTARDALTRVGTSEPGVEPLLTGTPGLRRPHFSRLDELWGATDRSLFVAGPLGVQEVGVGGLPGGELVALRVSPDAGRLVLVVRRPDGRRVLVVAGIVRRSDGVVHVVGSRQLAIHGVSNDPLDVVDAGWRTPDALMLLVADARGTTVVTVHPDGSEPVVVGPPGVSDLVELAVAPGVTPMVRSEDGDVYRYYADYRWASFGSGLGTVVYAG